MTEQNYIHHPFKYGKPIKAWTKGVPMDPSAMNQIENVARLPFIHSHVAVMPDVHFGIGATIGSVISTKGAIIPAAVGVDIGCGMVAARTTLKAEHLPDNLSEIRSAIEAAIPVGFKYHQEPTKYAEQIWFSREFHQRWNWLCQTHVKAVTKKRGISKSPVHQIGTLGGGNHFIEICLDESDHVWIMLHSGSRGMGNKIGMYFISKAKEEMEKMFISLPDKNLAYLVEGSTLFDDYVKAVGLAQDYARVNRDVMLEHVCDAMHLTSLPDFNISEGQAVNCHHNYVEKEHHFGANVWVTRKGALRAREGDLGIIPGSMGERSFIVRGKGNPDSFNSCSHGAGRVMSRTEAKKRFTVEDHVRDTADVECRKDEGVIDETPKAYKNIDDVMSAQKDLVEVLHTLKQVICVKG